MFVETLRAGLLPRFGAEPGFDSLLRAAQAKIAWDGLSDVGRRARKQAHGTPALLWLDVPLDGAGANDFKTLLKAKLVARVG